MEMKTWTRRLSRCRSESGEPNLRVGDRRDGFCLCFPDPGRVQAPCRCQCMFREFGECPWGWSQGSQGPASNLCVTFSKSLAPSGAQCGV